MITSNLTITEPAVLLPSLILTNPKCSGSCDGSLSTTPTGGTPPYTYLWAPGGSTTVSLTGLCAGNYSLTVTDANNCISTTTMTLTDPPALTTTATASNASCNNLCNGTIDLSPSGGTGTLTFLWSPGGQTTEDVTGLCPGIDSVLITDANGCTLTYSVSVGVITTLTAAAGNDTMFCEGGTALLCSGSINALSQVWYQLPGFSQIDTTLCVSVTPAPGINDYLVLVANGLCSDSDTVSVFVNASPAADAGANVDIPSGGSTVLNGTGGGMYLWAPATGLSSTTIANPVASPTVTTTYTLTVTDTSGCVGWDTVRVSIIKVVIPNDGISPNGDGVNDLWEIPNLESFPGALVEVYNRWGEMLMSTTDYQNNKWDGKYKGKELPVGTYYYVINLNSDLFPDPITGPITILR
jgi:gliding motility-associated-like protein